MESKGHKTFFVPFIKSRDELTTLQNNIDVERVNRKGINQANGKHTYRTEDELEILGDKQNIQVNIAHQHI